MTPPPPPPPRPSPTGLFVHPHNEEDQPPDGVDLWLFLRLKGLDARIDSIDDKLDLVVEFSRSSLIAKVCEHAVSLGGSVGKNENGQLKYVAAMVLGLAAMIWSVPATLDATGIHVFTPATQAPAKSTEAP